uniref:NSP1 protein n=1 Tax=Rotavirus A TaxID=28875 RepID=A0A0P0UPN7_9REOV|nr:NSP1 protein [Rotavirus A]BAS67010.1 NSP1 protein [Rotavirus A]BAS67011.1 NSP1 protein [Rotavirus A]BAS67012.1 NSP1 protein [Rotavirus A]
MASNQLRFEYSVAKFTRSCFTPTLKSTEYVNSMQWLSKERLNRHLWRTFNRYMIDDLPKGNCWTCGIFHNVYSCEFCNINHICRSCKENRIDLCPFVNHTTCRFAHDLIRIENCEKLTDDILLHNLIPLYEKYFKILSKISRSAVWKELSEKKHRGQRMHTTSSVAVDFNDCFLPTNIIAFKSVDKCNVIGYEKIYMNLLFGHYEPQRNREQMISYTNINLKQFRKTFDLITNMNLQLALSRGKASNPMVNMDVSSNVLEIPYVNDQAYICQLDDSKLNYALIHFDAPGKFMLCRPILSCFHPERLLKEIFTSWMVINVRVILTKLERSHYDSIFNLTNQLLWPNQERSYTSWLHFSYYENLVHDVLDNLQDIRKFAGASVHAARHVGLHESDCVSCRKYNYFIDVEMARKVSKILMKTCCYHDTRCADITTIFSISHRRNHDELVWRTFFDLRATLIHNANIVRNLLNQSGLIAEFDALCEWSDTSKMKSRHFYAEDNTEKLDLLQKFWSLSPDVRAKMVKKFNINTDYYRVFEVLPRDSEVLISITTEYDYELVTRPNSYKWLANILEIERIDDE